VRATAPPQGERLVLKKPACLIVARERFGIALESQDRENSYQGSEGDGGTSGFGSKERHARDIRSLTGNLDRELATQAGEPQALSERGENTLLARIEGGLLGWHVSQYRLNSENSL
jgi:hypothetical protein